jgi:nucleoside-diphosphate-sugar epimerase
MKTLVLGATGFIGSWVARALTRRGAEVVCLARPASDQWRLRGLDLTTVTVPESEWPQVIISLSPEVIVSLDWAGVAGGNRDDESQWANLSRQASVLNAAAISGARRVVGVGSQAEYGPKDERVIENALTNPRTAYGRAKLAAMEEARAFCAAQGIEWVWARVFSTFGPLDNGHWILPLVADALLEDRDIDLSSGEQLWSYLYAPDAAEAFAVLATHPGATGIYNLGNPEAPRLRSTIEEFASHFTSTGRLRFGAIPLGEDSVVRLEPDVSRLENLGWSVTFPLDTALEETARWLRSDKVADPLIPGLVLPERVR